ncbi:MAG: sensor histidine kinase, partial [Bacteroidota bacterium]
MKRAKVRLVIILGTMSVIGIIVIQIYWMQKTFSIKEKQFNQTVNIALRNVANIIFEYNSQFQEETCE